MSTRSSLALGLSLAVALLPACSAPKPEPEYASSANHSHYARDYPEKLNAVTTGFTERRAEARKLLGELGAAPGKLKDPSWPHVLEIVDRADEDGRSHAYVGRLRRVEGASAFFEAEKDEINRKVGGSVAYTAKKKGCDEAIAGAAAPALKDVVEKQLEKELRDGSEAQQLIERYRGELGKENAAALEKLADDLTRASFLVHIAIVDDKVRLLRMVSEADQVRKTADDAVAAEKSYQASYKKITDAEKKASEARIADLNKSKASMDAAVKQAQGVAPSLDDEIQEDPEGVRRRARQAPLQDQGQDPLTSGQHGGSAPIPPTPRWGLRPHIPRPRGGARPRGGGSAPIPRPRCRPVSRAAWPGRAGRPWRWWPRRRSPRSCPRRRRRGAGGCRWRACARAPCAGRPRRSR